MPSQFVCSNAMPGLDCGYPESLIQGILHLLSGLLCFFPFIRQCRKERNQSDFIFVENILYWIFASIWFLYRGITWIVPFDYSISEYHFFFTGLNQLLFIIPLSILMLILCKLLYLPNLPRSTLTLIRIIFFVFLFAFLITGAAISTIDANPDSNDIPDACQTGIPLFFWSGSVYLIILLFVSVPAAKLIRSLSDPIVQPQDRPLVIFSKIALGIFIVLQLFRSGFSFARYFIKNPILKCSETAEPSITSRIIIFFYYFILDFCVMWLSNAAVYLTYKHNPSIADFPYYIRTQA